MIEMLLRVLDGLSYSIQVMIYAVILLCLFALASALTIELIKHIVKGLISLYFQCKLHIRLGRCRMENKLACEKLKMSESDPNDQNQ